MSTLTRYSLNAITMVVIGLLVSPQLSAHPATKDKPIRVGIIGLDPSHVLAFTRLLNDTSRPDHVSGARVVAAWPQIA